MFKSKTVKLVKETLGFLDYEPKLKISVRSIPFSDAYIILGDRKSSRPRNPTDYIINSSKEVNEKEFAVRVAARAVRCRRQSGANKLETFPEIKMPDWFNELFSNIYFVTWGKYEADVEVVAFMAENLYSKGLSLAEVSEFVLMDASKIKKKYLKKG